MEQQLGPQRIVGMTFKDGLVFGLGFFTAGLVFTIVVGILSLMSMTMIAEVMIKSFNSADRNMDEFYVREMKAYLRNLAAAEEAYFADNQTYTSELSAMDLNISQAVTVYIHSADGKGWGAIAEHSRGAQSCALFYGAQYHKPALAEQEGVVKCSSWPQPLILFTPSSKNTPEILKA